MARRQSHDASCPRDLSPRSCTGTGRRCARHAPRDCRWSCTQPEHRRSGRDTGGVQRAWRPATRGAVFDFACRSGARIAGGDRAVVSGLGRFGRHAGVAWHMADDLAVMAVPDEDLAEAIEDRLQKHSPNYAVSLGAIEDPRISEIWMDFRRGAIDVDSAPRARERIVGVGVLSQGRRRTRGAILASADGTECPETQPRPRRARYLGGEPRQAEIRRTCSRRRRSLRRRNSR